MKRTLLCLLSCLWLFSASEMTAQNNKAREKRDSIIKERRDSIAKRNVYRINWKRDGWAVGAGATIMALGNFLQIKSEKATEENVTLLDRAGVKPIDRGAIGNYSSSADQISDIMLFTCVALPGTVFITQKGKIETKTVPVMVFEAFSINGGITSTMKALFKRYRPYTYNNTLTVQQRTGGSARESFPSGHVSNTAVGAFLTARILNDLYPDSKLKPYMWIAAASIPAATGYFRYKAGKHFPTDIMAGYLIGATIGYIVPTIHKSKKVSLNVSPLGMAQLNWVF